MKVTIQVEGQMGETESWLNQGNSKEKVLQSNLMEVIDLCLLHLLHLSI